MDNLNNKLSNEEQSQPSCLGAVVGNKNYGYGTTKTIRNG